MIGTAGRGFAVVAGEIQKLAEQTNSSMEELSDATDSLTATALQLKKLSAAVNENLNYFNTTG